MTESLTKRRMKVVEEAQKHFDFKNVQTQKGVVYCSFKGKKHVIHYLSDIHESTAFFKARNIYISA